MSKQQLRNTDKLTTIVDTYLATENVAEESLHIGVQLEKNEENDQYELKYFLKEKNAEGPAMSWPFIYDDIGVAWEEMLEQYAEIDQNYPEAEVSRPHPEVYEAAKGGGNPAVKLEDKAREF